MRIEKDTLINELEMVKAGLSPREFIEQSSCFVFQDGEVMTFNDEVACRLATCLNVNGAVQANQLLDILGKISDTALMVRENDKGELEFKGKRKGFGITKDAEIFLPIDRVERPKKWIPVPKDFADAVKRVQHCVSTDESKFLLTCVHIAPEHIEACDNLQIMRFKLKTGLSESVLVRGSSLAHITTLGMDEMAVTKSWIHFKNQAGLVLSCRCYSESYPDLDTLMKIKGHDIVLPVALKEASDCAAVFANDKSGDPLVSIKLSDGKCRIVGEGLTGWYRETKKVAYEGPALEFVIAPDLLNYIVEEYRNAKLSDCKLKASGGHWEYVTVLGKAAQEEDDEE